MIRITETPVMWVWMDIHTGIVFPETMYSTEAYARQQAERILGKRRLHHGEMVAVRVSLMPLNEKETAEHREQFRAWKAKHAQGDASEIGASQP